MIARLSEVIHHGAAAIDENLLRVGAVDIDLGHVQLPSNGTGSHKDLNVAGVLDGAVRKTGAVTLCRFGTRSRWS
jgi:hypothetical protein